VVYAASGTGPYAFTFEILAAGDIAVYRDDTLLTLTTDYSVTINSNGTGFVTLTATPTGATQIAIVGNRTIQRVTDFVTGGDFFANTLNDELDQQTIFNQQNSEALQRALIAPQTDPTTIDMTLPRASVRANKTLAFDANGDPTTGEVIGDNRGNWAAGVAYNKRDIVKDTSTGNVYYCNTSHTSSGSQPITTNADSAKWDLFVDNESSEAAQTAAEAAQAAAEAAQSAAETAETNAETAATNAASSASAASTSATNAASSASTASTQATNASNSATAAASSASSASTSATNASTSASNASTSATNASNSASAAATSETNAASSASAASTSASNASTSASNAASSASAASTSASNASTSATNAANSATAAATSETNAATSAASAAAALDSFDDRYLGAKTADPTVDNDGNALVTGALYYRTTTPVGMKVYDGAQWIEASAAQQSLMVTYEFVATSGQTTFSGTDANGATLSYVANSISVSLNGVTLRPGDDYTATNGTSVVLNVAAALNDDLMVIAFAVFNVANAVAKTGDTMTGSLLLPAGTVSAPALTTSADTNTGIFFPAADTIAFAEGGTEVARFDSSGNLGIGTSSPEGRFEIRSDANSAQQSYVRNVNAGSSAYSIWNIGNDSSETAFRMLVGSSTATAFGGANSANLVNSRNSPMTFWTNNTERARIDSSGNLLVGKTSSDLSTPGFGVDIRSGVLNGVSIIKNDSNWGTALFIRRNTGVGTGTVAEFNYDGTTTGTIGITATTTAYNTSSDYRLKDNVQPMTGALAKVALLKPCNYTWKADGSDGQGFIAHELAEVVPDCVTGEKDAVDEEGKPVYQGIDTSFLVATLTAALQEAHGLIKDLQARVDALEVK
jgi:hypothetical protein